MSDRSEAQAQLALVRVHINRHDYGLAPGLHRVTELKRIANIPPQDELEQQVAGGFTPLSDEGSVEIHGGEQFVSHVRSGGAS